ncbi:MAG TPA: hypothetical protein VM489_05360 [Burkholderiales bacterium]|nr:hypothetical protein [Burkholderiales bacterium]
MRFDRLCPARRALIFRGMKKAPEVTTLYRNPTPEELYALERIARAERARAVGEVIARAARAVKAAAKAVYGRALATISSKVVRHA